MLVTVFRLVGRKDLFFDGIQAILKSAYPEADIQQADGPDCQPLSGTDTIFIVDTAEVNLEDVLDQAEARNPARRVLAVSDSHSLNDLITYLAKGAQGCILRRQTAAELVDAIRRLSEGQVYLPNSVVGSTTARHAALHHRVEDRPDHAGEFDQGHRTEPAGTDPFHTRPLSGRQKSVMVLMARGLTNKAIARELSLAEGTVKVHVNNVFKQLQVNNRVQAIAKLAQFEFQKLGSSLLMFLGVGFTDLLI